MNSKKAPLKPSLEKKVPEKKECKKKEKEKKEEEKKKKTPLNITPQNMLKQCPFQCHLCKWYDTNIISHYKSSHKTTCSIQCLECKKNPIYDSDEKYVEHIEKRNHIWNDARVNVTI